MPRRVTSVDSTAEQRGEKRSDPEAGHIGQDVAIKSIGIEDTEEECPETGDHTSSGTNVEKSTCEQRHRVAQSGSLPSGKSR